MALRISPWIALGLSLGLVLASAAARGDVVVKIAPAVVERKTFERANPPADMPRLELNEAAVTTSRFDCAAGVKYDLVDQHQKNNQTAATVKVTQVTMTLELHVVIWLPVGASAKLAAHEDGHRQITQAIYAKRAEASAREAAAVIDGKRLSGTGDSWKEAARGAVNPSIQRIGQRYIDLTAGMSGEVNATYDALTRHGTNELEEAKAIDQAFDRYAADHEKKKMPAPVK